MLNDPLLPFYALVDFLADYLGSSTEVVLHDLTDLEHSVVKIRNGYISGRREGDPATDLVMRTIFKGSPEPYICNYKSASRFDKPLKSASYYIKNDYGKIIGMLCLNTSIDSLLSVQEMLDSFLDGLSPKNQPAEPESTRENFGLSISDIIDTSIERTLEQYKDNSNLSVAEKEGIISQLNEEGVFLLKGSVTKVAAALDMSESTLYRYLQKVKAN